MKKNYCILIALLVMGTAYAQDKKTNSNSGQEKASIATSRSNIKRPGTVKQETNDTVKREAGNGMPTGKRQHGDVN